MSRHPSAKVLFIIVGIIMLALPLAAGCGDGDDDGGGGTTVTPGLPEKLSGTWVFTSTYYKGTFTFDNDGNLIATTQSSCGGSKLVTASAEVDMTDDEVVIVKYKMTCGSDTFGFLMKLTFSDGNKKLSGTRTMISGGNLKEKIVLIKK